MNNTIGLIHSPEKKFSTDQNYGLLFAPIWAYALASYLKRNNINVKLFDLNIINLNEIDQCDYFFFSGINQDLDSILSSHKFIKNKFPNTKTFIGGPIAWSFKQAGELLRIDCFDYVCIGDGELLLEHIIQKNFKLKDKVLEIKNRFVMTDAIPMDQELINQTASAYYGGVVEVSRGCPFLCEFCDIRVMPDNNRNHSKPIDVIIKELDILRRNGVNNIQLACDNFIGDPGWADELVDAIIIYNKKNGWNPSFYTWLTINIGRNDNLMKKMRIAGFDNLFIGVESFNQNTLIETAKLQNTKYTIAEILKTIQSYGFVVVAGLIFGFDSDDDKSFNSTLDGILQAGLLSGDASLLTALPGTPLYRRMKLSNRLRNFDNTSFLGGYKYVTNIKYLMDKEKLVKGYINFSQTFMDGKYQYKRLKNFYEIIINSNNFMNFNRAGYTNVFVLLYKAIKKPSLFIFHFARMLPLIHPNKLIYLIKGVFLFLRYRVTRNIGSQFFFFWLFIWVNALNKYGKLKPSQFNIDNVPSDFLIENIIPKNYREDATEDIPKNKIDAQYNATVGQLKKVIEIRSK